MNGMRAPENARITTVWIATCALTGLSALVAWLSRGNQNTASTGISLVVLAIGGVKARLILQEFMEVRTAPAWLRLLSEVWLFGLLAAIVILYLQ
jgi:hypothetical protein